MLTSAFKKRFSSAWRGSMIWGKNRYVFSETDLGSNLTQLLTMEQFWVGHLTCLSQFIFFIYKIRYEYFRIGDGQGSLACCDSWGCKESDATEQLN